MDMIAYAANTNDLTSRCVDELADIAMHALQVFVCYLRTGGFHVEDNMEINFAKRL